MLVIEYSSGHWACRPMADCRSVAGDAGRPMVCASACGCSRARAATGSMALVADADGGMALKVAVTAAPRTARRMTAVIALLAKDWGLAKSALALVAGATDRRKIIKLAGRSSAALPAQTHG